jgi:hypothetical protein
VQLPTPSPMALAGSVRQSSAGFQSVWPSAINGRRNYHSAVTAPTILKVLKAMHLRLTVEPVGEETFAASRLGA